MFLDMNQWSSGMITGSDSDDMGSNPRRVNFGLGKLALDPATTTQNCLFFLSHTHIHTNSHSLSLSLSLGFDL